MQLLSVFKSKKKEEQKISFTLQAMIKDIEDCGYAVISLLDEKTDTLFSDESKQIVEKTQNIEPFEGFLSVGRINNSALRNTSKNINKKYLEKVVNLFFENKYDIITGMHLFKKKGKKGVLNPHQDSSLTDERIFTSYFLWYPINGADEHDGTIEVIPNSHKLPILQRSLNIAWPLLQFEKELWKLMKKIKVKKGQAVVIDSRTIHGSGINKKRAIRMASNLFLKPKEAPFLHYYAENPDSENIDVYKVDELFYSNKNIIEKPEGYELYRTEKNENASYSKFSMLEATLKSFSKFKDE